MKPAPPSSEFTLRDLEGLGDLGFWRFPAGSKTLVWSVGAFPIHRHVQLEEAILRCRAEGASFDLEIALSSENGNQRWIRVTGRAGEDGAYGEFRDVTEWKRLSLALDGAQMACWEFDGSLEQFCWDPRMFALHGLPVSTGAIPFSRWRSLLHSEDADRVEAEYRRCFAEKRDLDIQYRVRLENGSVKHLSTRAKGFLGAGEASSRISGVSWDISDVKTVADGLELVRASQLESAKFVALGEMAAGIAHEINNPLTILLGRVELLTKRIEAGIEISKEEVLRTAKKLRDTIFRVEKIVKGLRAFARVGDRDSFFTTRLDAIIGDVLDISRERFRNTGIELKVECPHTVSILCRPVQIGQVLLNLLSNSYDAVIGTEKPWVSIEVRTEGGRVFIAVMDSGSGIPLDHQARLMAPFFTTKPIGKGVGLGLSIVKGIADSHGGIFFLDKKSPNTRFILDLPIADAARLGHRVSSQSA